MIQFCKSNIKLETHVILNNLKANLVELMMNFVKEIEF